MTKNQINVFHSLDVKEMEIDLKARRSVKENVVECLEILNPGCSQKLNHLCHDCQ